MTFVWGKSIRPLADGVKRIQEYRTFGWDGKKWVMHYYFINFLSWQIGIHFCLENLNIEIHVPFGFFILGRRSKELVSPCVETKDGIRWFGKFKNREDARIFVEKWKLSQGM